MPDVAVSVTVVGGGPAGLATSRELARLGVDHVVLERGGSVGHVWENLYDGLVLHTGKHLSSLPGMPFPASTPLFPTRRNFVDYLRRYAETFRVPIRTGAEVTDVERVSDVWHVRTAGGETIQSRCVVAATGIVSNPRVPAMPGAERFGGTMVHSVAYRRPQPFSGRRVLVVGAGNSAGEIAVELAHAGAQVTVAVRSGARVVPLQLLGVPIQYFAVALAALPITAQRAIEDLLAGISARVRGPVVVALRGPAGVTRNRTCSNVPLIGFHLVDAVASGTIVLKPGVVEFTAAGVRFADGSEQPVDDVILATGYRAALGMFGGRVKIDVCGFAVRHSRVVSGDQPGLFFVGHNYDTTGGLKNIARDAKLAARHVRERLDTAPT